MSQSHSAKGCQHPLPSVPNFAMACCKLSDSGGPPLIQNSGSRDGCDDETSSMCCGEQRCRLGGPCEETDTQPESRNSFDDAGARAEA